MVALFIYNLDLSIKDWTKKKFIRPYDKLRARLVLKNISEGAIVRNKFEENKSFGSFSLKLLGKYYYIYSFLRNFGVGKVLRNKKN